MSQALLHDLKGDPWYLLDPKLFLQKFLILPFLPVCHRCYVLGFKSMLLQMESLCFTYLLWQFIEVCMWISSQRFPSFNHIWICFWVTCILGVFKPFCGSHCLMSYHLIWIWYVLITGLEGLCISPSLSLCNHFSSCWYSYFLRLCCFKQKLCNVRSNNVNLNVFECEPTKTFFYTGLIL